METMTTVPLACKPPSRRIEFSVLIFVLLAVVLGVLVILPLFWLLYYAFRGDDGSLTLQNLAALFSDASLFEAYKRTIGMGLGVAVLTCVVATPMAWLVARTDLPLRRHVRMLVTASFVTPPFLGAIAYEILAAPNSGLVNVAYRALFGLERGDRLVNIYTFPGLVFVIACFTFPYVFTLVANALDKVPSDLEDASSMLGGKSLTTLRKVTIPWFCPPCSRAC